MRHLIASIPNVPVRILLAAFLAALCVLLPLLPAAGQGTFDRTDGRINSGGLSVGVFADITDAQLAKNQETTSTFDGSTLYLPVPTPPTTPIPGTVAGSLSTMDTAYLANGQASPQHTFFGDSLWVSNDPAAYNTILITAESALVADTESDDGCVVATVRNAGASQSITVQMALTSATGAPDQMQTYYQAFVRVLDLRAVDANGDPLYDKSSDGPACTDYPAGVAHADTPFILARHEDRITVNVAGAGEVTLEVDGEGPEVIDITPEDLAYTRSSSLDYSFVVRDANAGLRHDGELVVTRDGDYTEVNADEDHVTTGEPLSMPSGGQQISVNGEAADIDLNVWAEDADPSGADDITGTGSWTLQGNRPGVAYSFSAGGDHMDEGAYYMEITAVDRVGNETVSEAPDDEYPGPHAFTVDDTDPVTSQAWTGIAYDPDLTMMGKVVGGEFADRSWIMAEFTEPLRPGTKPGQIRVAGHEVVSVYQPNYAPPFLRDVVGRSRGTLAGTQRSTFAPPVPRAAAQLAPNAQGACTPPGSEDKVPSLGFTYNETTGDASISWGRLSEHDCNGYRLAILAERTVLIVEDLERTTTSYDIPRASQLGRAIEAEIKDGDQDDLTILVALQHESVGSQTDTFGSAEATATVSPHTFTAPSTPVSGGVTGPYLLHPPSAPSVLPAVRSDDTSLTCRLTSATPPSDEVVFSFTHREATYEGWTRVGYYRQLFYPPNYDVDLGRLFGYTAVADDPAEGTNYETSVSYQGFYTWDTDDTPRYDAQGQVVAVYENSSGRRLAGAVRTLWCSATSVTNPDVDNRAPVLRRAEVAGSTLRLVYNEPLDGGSTPGTSAFDVNVDGSPREVTDVSVDGSTVELTLRSPVEAGERVTVSYTKPGTRPTQDIAGNDAFSFRNWPVSNVFGGGDNGEGYIDVDGRTHEEALAELGYWPIDINGELIPDTRTRIYIELAEELRADETPVVAILSGAAYDLAGNTNVTEDVQTRDGIAPRFTITVTGTAQDRPVANARGEFVVDVRADEDLRRRPLVYFTGIDTGKVTRSGEDAYDYSIANLEQGGSLSTQEDALHWSRTYQVADLSGLDELFGLVVYGFDREGNIGESGGWTPPRHQRTAETGPPSASRGENDTPDALDLTKMDAAGVLLEIDRLFNGGAEPVHAVTPNRRMRDNETESVNPIISIRFPMEEDEYAVCPDDGCGEANGNPDAEFSDSHARVDITAITLNGEDAASQLSRVSAGRFALVAQGLELGGYEIEYTAVDETGNDYDGEFTFSVLEREPYELKVLPGWNLISFPGTPEDPSLGAVVPSGKRVSPVLAYQDGDWLTAVVGSDGEWAGNLTEFEAGFGYWLFTTAYATLNPLIPEPEQTATLPTAPVRYGWNLLGVMDIFQNPVGTPPGPDGDGEADDYFRSIPWRVAYTYDTVYSLWMRSVPDSDRAAPEGTSADEPGFRLAGEGDEARVVMQEILNGKGYWVWSSEPATLVP